LNEFEFVDRPLIYVAGPYKLPDPVDNTRRAIQVAGQLVDGGKVTPLVPHLALAWQMVDPRPVDFWYPYDLALVARCDAVLRLEGTSTGADREVDFAERNGIPVFRSVDALYGWLDSGGIDGCVKRRDRQQN
jgi:hypothetical protein